MSRRRHRLIKVYSAGVDGHDLLFIGHVEMDFRNGRGVAGEFTGRLVIDQGESEQGRHPKLLLYQVWAVSHIRFLLVLFTTVTFFPSSLDPANPSDF